MVVLPDADTEAHVVIASIFAQARDTPDRTAVVYNGLSCSYACLARWIEDTCEYLSQHDVPAGTVGVICVERLLHAWVIGIALRRLGLNTIATRNAGEAIGLDLRDVGCLVSMADEGGCAPGVLPADVPWRHISVPPRVISLDLTRRGTGRPTVSGSIRALPGATTAPGGHIMLTSGTTGAYKKVLRDASAEALATPAHAKMYGISDRSVVYVANFGLWTAGGYRWPLVTWSVGGTVVMHQAPDLRQPLARHPISEIFATPNLLRELTGAPEGALGRNDYRRLFVTGGALPRNLLVAAKRTLTSQVYSLMASTEASVLGITLIETPEDLRWQRIHPSREVQVVDDAGRVMGPGEQGLVRARVLDGVTGYLDDEAATKAFFRDGYFYSGDIGMFGPDGRLSLRGRASDVINVLGDKIAPDPIERALQDRLGAEGVCIVAIQGESAEEEVHVVVQSSRPIAPAELLGAARQELGPIMNVPWRCSVVKALPRNEMGKVRRPVLKRQLLQARADAGRPGGE